jgi:hypothetical protein
MLFFSFLLRPVLFILLSSKRIYDQDVFLTSGRNNMDCVKNRQGQILVII